MDFPLANPIMQKNRGSDNMQNSWDAQTNTLIVKNCSLNDKFQIMSCGIMTVESLSISMVKGKKIRIKISFSVKKILLSLELERVDYLRETKSISLYIFESFSVTCSL